LDLRSHEEVQDDAAADKLLHRAATTVSHVPLGDRATIGRVLMRRARLVSILRYVARRFILGDAEGAKGEMVSYLGGLVGLNELMLRHEGAQIAAALKVLTTRDTPVLLYCTAGKDRTGLVSALAMSAAGEPRDGIVHEFSQSDKHKHVIFKRAMQSVLPNAEEGMEWAGAPAHVMERTFEFIDREFGGVDAYLDSIGFSASWRGRLRARLVGEPGEGLTVWDVVGR
jgi:hypothetical protein